MALKSSIRIGAKVSPSWSAMAGRCRPMTRDNQMLFFLGKGYRVIAHDRRGHGRSTQVADGHDLDHYADDLAAVTAHLYFIRTPFMSAIRPVAARLCAILVRHGESRGSRAAIISAVPPLMVKTAANPKVCRTSLRRPPGAQPRRQSRGVLLRSARGSVRSAVQRPAPKSSRRISGIGGAKASPAALRRTTTVSSPFHRPTSLTISRKSKCLFLRDAQPGRSNRP